MTEQTDQIQVKIVSPNHTNRPLSLDVAAQREKLANFLRANHPNEWAEVSHHESRGAARQVRDRMKGRECWHGFEWAVRQDPEFNAVAEDGKKVERHVVFAKFVKAEDAPEETPQPVIRTLDEISPVL